MRVVRHETWEVASRPPLPELRPYLLRDLEGWRQTHGAGGVLREVPFPGIPLIVNLGAPWGIGTADAPEPVPLDSFVAALHPGAALVHAPTSSECIELRLTPLGARRLLGMPLHELGGRVVALGDLLPGVAELEERVFEARTWEGRLDLVERFVAARVLPAAPPPAGVAWAWHRLVRSGGREPVGALAAELGWSRRRLIARFRDHVGLPPKTAARIIRFDRAVARLRARAPGLADVAYECGYFDQAHLNRDFRELAGITPTQFVAASAPSGAVRA